MGNTLLVGVVHRPLTSPEIFDLAIVNIIFAVVAYYAFREDGESKYGWLFVAGMLIIWFCVNPFYPLIWLAPKTFLMCGCRLLGGLEKRGFKPPDWAWIVVGVSSVAVGIFAVGLLMIATGQAEWSPAK